jgi:hypothetical protein
MTEFDSKEMITIFGEEKCAGMANKLCQKLAYTIPVGAKVGAAGKGRIGKVEILLKLQVHRRTAVDLDWAIIGCLTLDNKEDVLAATDIMEEMKRHNTGSVWHGQINN